MYSKIFASMYDGTIVDAGWEAIVTFQQLIILSDPCGAVDMTAEAISRRTTIPLHIITKGIAILSLPDPQSRSPAQEGRRIVLLDEGRPWGWQIVNFTHYRDIRTQSDRREYMREYMRERRAKVSDGEQVLTPVSAVSPRIRKTQDADADADASKNPPTPKGGAKDEPPEFLELRRIYPKRAGDQGWPRALQACRARIREGCTWGQIIEGAERYARFIEATGKTGTEYVKQAQTFCGPGKPFLESWDPPASTADIRQSENIATLEAWLADSNSPEDRPA